MRRSLNPRGVTLIELLVVMVLMGLVATAMFSVYQGSRGSSRTEEDVVELQQLLRTAIDRIAADIRMAGFVVGTDVAPFALARTETSAGAVVSNPYPPGAAPISVVHLFMRTASAQGQAIRIADDSPATAGTSRSFTGIPAEQLVMFNTSGDFARVYRAATSDQPLLARYSVALSPTTGTPTTLTLTPVDPTGATLANTEFKRGDLIARVFSTTPATARPEYVYYTTAAVAAMPRQVAGNLDANGNRYQVSLDPAITITRAGGYCVSDACFPLTVGNVTSVGTFAGVIGTQQTGLSSNTDTNIPRITRLSFSYILRDGSEVTGVADATRGTSATSPLRNIAAVRVTVAGQTPSGKRRELSTVVRLMNRGYEAVRE